MSKYIPGNQKHLSLEDRKYIERSLNCGTSFKDIARFLCKDPTTISKEVKLHRLSDWYHKGTFYNAHNFCIHRYHCKKIIVVKGNIPCSPLFILVSSHLLHSPSLSCLQTIELLVKILTANLTRNGSVSLFLKLMV